MNYRLKINVKKLNKAFIFPIQGKFEKVDCLCIPVSEFYEGKPDKDGHIPLYCNLEITEKKQIGQYNDTHFAKQSLEKASYNALSDEQKKNIPIIGNMELSKFGNNTPTQPNEPQAQAQAQAQEEPEGDGLPF
jgi:hypothetical protein